MSTGFSAFFGPTWPELHQVKLLFAKSNVQDRTNQLTLAFKAAPAIICGQTIPNESMRHSLVVLLFAAGSALAQPFQALLSSPNRALSISFLTVSNDQPARSGQLVYTVSFRDRPLLDRSALRLDLKDQPPLGSNVRLVTSTTSRADRSPARTAPAVPAMLTAPRPGYAAP